MGEVMTMRMAKASDKEIEQAIILAGVIEDAESGQFPRTIEGEFNEDDPDYFDEDDPEHLKAFYERVKSLSRGLFRVTFGFSTLMNSQNELVDPGLDHLAMHPRLIAALEGKDDAERWRALVGCKRVRVLGTAGVLPEHRKEDGYAHIGLEIWTRHSHNSEPEAVELLTTFADIARSV